ncbi:MAG: cell surface protein, partial [Clostridium sp.]|nr:cell surface protein [Clostridium sp.]
NGKWYYLESNGVMAADKWIGDYYVKSDGTMAINEWIGPYYVGADGKWIKGYKATA